MRQQITSDFNASEPLYYCARLLFGEPQIALANIDHATIGAELGQFHWRIVTGDDYQVQRAWREVEEMIDDLVDFGSINAVEVVEH